VHLWVSAWNLSTDRRWCCPKVLPSAAIAIPQLPRHHNGTTHVWSFPLQVAITVGMAAARFEWLPLGEFDELVKTPKAMGLQRFEPGEFQSSERRFQHHSVRCNLRDSGCHCRESAARRRRPSRRSIRNEGFVLIGSHSV